MTFNEQKKRSKVHIILKDSIVRFENNGVIIFQDLWNTRLWAWVLFSNSLHTSVMRVGSDTFGDPIFQKGLQN